MTGQGSDVRCERVVKIHRLGDQDVPALAGLDMTAAAGEILGVVGPSGCGKSTLLNVIGGLCDVTSGRAFVSGVDVSSLRGGKLGRFRRDTIGFVWQEASSNLLAHLSVLENVMVPLWLQRSRRGSKVNAASHAHTVLGALGVGELATARPHQLSGGQQQRVAVAVALAASPSLLLADEPTGALDARSALDVYAALRSAREEFGVTVIVVSHDDGLGRYCDRVVELRDGQTAAERSVSGVGPVAGSVLLIDSTGRIRLPDDVRQALNGTERVVVRITPDQQITLRAAEPIPASDLPGDSA